MRIGVRELALIMKKILIKRCIDCPRMGRYFNNACHRAVTDVNHIPADCPLEDDLPESRESNNDGDWLSPIPYEREHQEKQLKALWPDYPNGCPRWQTMNGLLFYTNKFMELDQSDGWIPVSERLPEDKTACLTCFKGNLVDFEMYLDGEFENGDDPNRTHWQPLPQPPQDQEKE